MRTFRFGTLIVFAALISPSLQAAELAGHQAAYSLSLSSRKNNAEIVGLSGVLTTRLEKACEGWILAQKMSQRFDTPSSGIVASESSSAVMEAFDGHAYKFNTRQKNGAAQLDIGGSAKRNANGETLVRYVKPLVKEMALPGETVFPIGHTRLLIEAALAGKKQVSHRIFDGFDGATGYFVTTIIHKLTDGGGPFEGASPLLRGDRWNMRLAYFPAQADASEPIMEISVVLRSNGVAEKIVYQYERFGIQANLEQVEPIAQPDCR